MPRIVKVPLVRLTEETAKGYGTVISSIDEAEPILREGEIVREAMEVRYQGDELYFENHAVDDKGVIGKIVDGNLLVGMANYHGDASQAFIGKDRKPTVYLLAKPSETAVPENFVAFYSDGNLGLCMDPDVWHITPLPVEGTQEYDNLQGNHYHHKTVLTYFDDVLLEVPLREPAD